MIFLRTINKIKLISACAKISQNKHRLLTAAICVLRYFKVGRYSYKMSTWRWSTSSKTDIYQSCGLQSIWSNCGLKEESLTLFNLAWPIVSWILSVLFSCVKESLVIDALVVLYIASYSPGILRSYSPAEYWATSLRPISSAVLN